MRGFSRELVFLETMDFGNILQAADKHARSGRRVKKTSRTDSRYLQGFLHGRYHRFRCVKGCESGVFEALDVCLVFFPVFGILTQQFMQQSDLGKQFPVCRSSFNVRVFSAGFRMHFNPPKPE